MKRRLWLLMLFLLAGHVPAASADSACEGRFVNPITDICWSCIFPLSLGSIKVSQGTHQKIIDMAMNGVGCRATARIMGVGLNTILRHLKNSGRSR
ncbi:insA C-terminal domain protein [Escherichia coli 3-105-05_S3_C3]|nr:insA C-terminal domain protein [Escherichia coli 3-105-05_S3_C3]